MFKDIAKRAGAGLAAAILLGVSAATTLVAAAFATYAGFKLIMIPAAASALTALITAVVTGTIALIASRVAGGDRHARSARHEHDQHGLGLGSVMQIGSMVVPVLLELLKGHREKKARKRLKASKR